MTLHLVVLGCSLTGLAILCHRQPDPPISRRTLRRINQRLEERE